MPCVAMLILESLISLHCQGATARELQIKFKNDQYEMSTHGPDLDTKVLHFFENGYIGLYGKEFPHLSQPPENTFMS